MVSGSTVTTATLATTGILTIIGCSFVPANRFISLPVYWESFVFAVARANRQAFCLLHPSLSIKQYISCYPVIWFPKESLKIFSVYRFFL